MNIMEQLFQTIGNDAFSLMEILVSLTAALAVGGIISFTFHHTNKGQRSGNFMTTLILLPAVVSALIMLIGSDVARAFSLAGAFSIIRFRSSPGDPKDIAFILFAMASGLAAGIGMPQYAFLVAFVLCGAMFLLHFLRITEDKLAPRELQITVPEDMDYDQALQDVLDNHTSNYHLKKVKMTAMGSLCVLTYDVELKNDQTIKRFIDDLRIRNGNLNIQLNLLNVGI